MDPNKWRIESVQTHVSTGPGDPSRWGYLLFEPGYVQCPIAVSDSWQHLWRLINLCGYIKWPKKEAPLK